MQLHGVGFWAALKYLQLFVLQIKFYASSLSPKLFLRCWVSLMEIKHWISRCREGIMSTSDVSDVIQKRKVNMYLFILFHAWCQCFPIYVLFTTKLNIFPFWPMADLSWVQAIILEALNMTGVSVSRFSPNAPVATWLVKLW